jgi:uncharacterized protein (DUF779 family)
MSRAGLGCLLMPQASFFQQKILILIDEYPLQVFLVFYKQSNVRRGRQQLSSAIFATSGGRDDGMINNPRPHLANHNNHSALGPCPKCPVAKCQSPKETWLKIELQCGVVPGCRGPCISEHNHIFAQISMKFRRKIELILKSSVKIYR